MTFKVKPDPKVEDIFRRLVKKDRQQFEQIKRKLEGLAENPNIGKPLRYDLKGERRIHIGHFVLTYSININENLIRLLDYDHHDNVYK